MIGLLSIRDVAAEYGVKSDTVRAWIARGIKIRGERIRLGSIKIGGKVRISREAVNAFISGCNPPPRPELPSERERRRLAQEAKERGMAATRGVKR